MVEIQGRSLRGVAIVLAALVLTGCGWHGVRLAPGGGADIADGAVPPERTEAVAASPSVEPGQPTAPPSDLIRWETNPIRRTSTGARVFSGTVTNTDDRWSIRNVLLELKLLDGNGELIDTLYAEVQDLNPGDRGDYTIAVPSEVGFELSNLRLTWDWLLR